MSTKAYVLVTNLPPTFKGNNFFYKLLKQQVGGGLLGAMIEDHSTLGLAIFDNAQSALAACKENIMFKGTKNLDGTTDVYTAILRIVETEHEARAAESVYNDSIQIEGVSVKKEDIDFTYGFQLALRGEQGAAWCHHTRNKQSCPLSAKCKFIHLKECQTSKKRLRGVAANQAASGLVETEDRNVPAASLLGMPFLAPRFGDAVIITPQMAEGLLEGRDDVITDLASKLLSSAAAKCVMSSDLNPRSSGTSTDLPTLVRSFIRIESEVGGTTEMDYFTETHEGLSHLKTLAKCILPSNGCPTPIERDAFIREILAKRNIAAALLADTYVRVVDENQNNLSITTYIPAFSQRIKTFLCSLNVQRQLSSDNISAAPVRITLEPRYCVDNPTVQEMTFFMKDGIVTGVTQHYDDVLAPRSLFEGDTPALRDDLHFIWDRVMEVRAKLEQWASRTHKSASVDGLSVKRGAMNSGSNFSGALHVVFPTGQYVHKPLKEDQQNNLSYPELDDISRTPQALLRCEEVVTANHFNRAQPVILGVKVYDSAALRSSLFNGTPSIGAVDSNSDTRSTRPLWRRVRTSPTPLYPRSIIDKLAE